MPPTGAPTPPTKLINSLPPEVLIKSSPWTLALVCRHWKSITDSVPSFWSTLVVSFPPISEVCAKRGVNEEGAERLTSALPRGVNAALLRSREHPLQICLSSSSDFTAIQFLPEALSLCLRHCKRWEGAYMEFWLDALDWRCPDLLEIIGRDMDGNRLSFPRLRNLSLKGPGSVSTSVSLPKMSWLYMFQEAPLLSAVQFKGDPHLVPGLQGTLNWSNLTQFSTEMSSVELFLRCCRVLCACPKRVVLKPTLPPYPSQPQLGMDLPGSGTPFRDAELPELRDFWICFEGGGRFDLSPIFRFFPCSPRLSRMSLQPTKSVSITNDFLTELANFTSRSRCAISYLLIDYLQLVKPWH